MNWQLSNPSLLKAQALINGQWANSDNGDTYAVINPATGEEIAQVAKCGRDETTTAVEAAATALPAWSAKSAKERANILRAWYNLMVENADDLALILTTEQGKPLAEAKGEISYGSNFIEWFSEEAKRIDGDVIAPPSSDKRIVVVRQPIGVVACITPWNFPNAMLARKIAPALAAGCTVVCKAANETPLSALAMAELAIQAGVPAGVINLVNGRTSEIGDVLTSHPSIRKLTFTGSTEVGKELIKACAGTVKRTSMELGGNAPFIVFADADLDLATNGIVGGKLRNGGQTCVSPNRFFVHEDVYQQFIQIAINTLKAQKIGNGVDPGVTLGPMVNQGAANGIYGMIDKAVADGATLVHGGQRTDLGPCYVQPTILGDVTEAMEIFHSEIFGPVLQVIKFRSDEEAVAMANNTPFGLAAYMYTNDYRRQWKVSEALEYGIVGINDAAVSNEMAPFGGVKESGNGREGSKYGIDDYVEVKYICIGGI
jgi:succinate-semialdehyde dehydrogenase/glutarate-semialdehyde dehydrogenase